MFKVEPKDLFGVGNVTNILGLSEREAAMLARAPQSFSYKGDGGFDVPGLIAVVGIDKAVSEFSAAMESRLNSRTTSLDYISYELKRAAWRYTAQDRATADQIAESHSKIENYGGYNGLHVAPMTDATPFSPGDHPDTGMPTPRTTDIRAVIDQSKGILTEIDQAVREVTAWVSQHITDVGGKEGWSPLEQVVGPLTGNWAELERAGECFKKAGAASETVAASLTARNSDLAHTWQGKAADSYQDFGGRLTKAMAWEGPIGRISEAVLSAMVEQALAAIVDLLNYVNKKFKEEIVDQALKFIRDTAITAGIPGVGWMAAAVRGATKAYNLGMAIYHIYTEVAEMIKKIKEMIEAAKAVLVVLENPEAAAEKEINQRIDKVKEKVDKADKLAGLGQDVISAGDITAITRAPKDKYAAATGTEAWAD